MQIGKNKHINKRHQFGQRPGKSPTRGKPFKITILLDCHTIFNRDYNELKSIN